MLAVPSLTGVFASRRLKQSLDGFNNLVHQAQERSVMERRPYLIVWNQNGVLLRPEVFGEDEEVKATAQFGVSKGSVLRLYLLAALEEKHRWEWIFSGPPGGWTANYSHLTVQPEITQYAAR